jgi:hypothetical protein
MYFVHFLTKSAFRDERFWRLESQNLESANVSSFAVGSAAYG